MNTALDFQFDRTVSASLMDMLRTGPASHLVELARRQPPHSPRYDLQLRRVPKGKSSPSRATLYYGLTALLNLHERKGRYRLTAHKSYQAVEAFDTAWTTWQRRESIEAAWPQVAEYLEAVVAVVPRSQISKEGPVHASIGAGRSDAYRVINREATPSFANKCVKARRLANWVMPYNKALSARTASPAWWPKAVKVGSSLDFLAVDIGGRLGIVEAKFHGAQAGELAKVAVQVGVYASIFRDLLHDDPGALKAFARMLAQRSSLGLSPAGGLHLRDERRVVPVIAIGPGRPSGEVHDRMWQVAESVSQVHGSNIDPVEVWYLDADGRISEVERAEDLHRSRAA